MQEFGPAGADCGLQDTANFPPSTRKSNNFGSVYVSSFDKVRHNIIREKHEKARKIQLRKKEEMETRR